MARTSTVKNLEEQFIYGIISPYDGNGLIKTLAVKYLRLYYDTLAVNSWVIGDIVTGTNSSAEGTVVAIYESGTAGYIDLDNTLGTFEDEEGLTGGDLGTTANVRINRALNGDFGADELWTKGAGWSIAAGKAVAAAGAGSDLAQTTKETDVGDDYLVRFTVSDRTAGTVTAKIGSAGAVARSTNDTFTEIITCVGDGIVRFTKDATFDGKLDDVYVEGPIQHVEETTRNAEDVFTDADDEVVVRAVKAVKGTTDTVLTLAQELGYDNDGGTPPVVDEVVEGAGGAVAVVVAVHEIADPINSGTMTLKNITGTFNNDEAITGSVALNALVNGTLANRTATFSEGDPPDEAKQITVLGAGLSPTLITGGAAGQIFEVLRGFPTYSSSDYILYCTAKSHEEGEQSLDVRDKGQIQHRKNRADIERRLSLTVSYVNSKTGLLNLADQDIVLIAERDDDRVGSVSEYHVFLQARINMSHLPDEAEGDDFSNFTINARFERAYCLAG